jgi:replicative DNA helicase
MVDNKNVIQTERVLLGTLINRPNSYESIGDTPIKPESFLEPFHADVFAKIEYQANRGEKWDLRTLNKEMKLDAAWLQKLVDITEFGRTHGWVNLAIEVVENSLRRDSSRIASKYAKAMADPVNDPIALHDEIIAELQELTQNLYRHKPRPLAEAAIEFHKEAMIKVESFRGGNEISGLRHNLRRLAPILPSFMPQKYYILAARPAMGKTAQGAVALPLAIRDNGDNVGIIELEMPWEELVLRMFANKSEINSRKIEHGSMTDAEIIDFNRACDNLGRLDGEHSRGEILMDDQSRYDTECNAMARQMVYKMGAKMIARDYLTLTLTRKRHDRRDLAVGDMARQAKDMAKALNIPWMDLAQLGRKIEDRSVKIPELADLRESGEIEQHADVVMTLYTPANYGPEYFKRAHTETYSRYKMRFGEQAKEWLSKLCRIDVLKHRGGKLGHCWVYFDKATSRFYDVPDDHYGLIDDDDAEKGAAIHEREPITEQADKYPVIKPRQVITEENDGIEFPF